MSLDFFQILFFPPNFKYQNYFTLILYRFFIVGMILYWKSHVIRKSMLIPSEVSIERAIAIVIRIYKNPIGKYTYAQHKH